MPNDLESRRLNREIFLAFWKVHILHHAAEGGVVGQWMLQELREHGYDVSPGTLYPLLRRMESHGWLRSKQPNPAHTKGRRTYHLTAKGRKTLVRIRAQVHELRSEILGE